MEFVREKIFLMGEPVFMYHEKSQMGQLDGFRIEAKRAGVQMVNSSPLFEAQEDLEVYAKAEADAWGDHLRLVPRIDLDIKIPGEV